MNLLARSFAAASFAGLLISCGGGGAGGPSPSASAKAFDASLFTGHFNSPCFAIPKGTNYESGAALYGKSLISVGTATGSAAPLELRFDFFDNSSCTGEAIGLLRNTNPANVFDVLGEVSVSGGTASKVQLSFAAAGESYSPGPSADTVIIGANLRVSVPRYYLQAFAFKDLWLLRNEDLYVGQYETGADGFPVGLSSAPAAVKLSSPPALPATPCAAMPVTWSANNAVCTANTTPSASNQVQLQFNTSISSRGSASLTCLNGAWSVNDSAECAPEYVPPVSVSCPGQTHTWSVNGRTCQANVPLSYASNVVTVFNTVPEYLGTAVRICNPDGSWADWSPSFTGSCDVKPPPPPPITDPLELAQSKNCMNCHTVTGPGLSMFGVLSFPSFQKIANFYRASPPAPGLLEGRVKAGSVGVFGTTPMPANPQVSDADLAILIPWILAIPE